MMLLRQDQRMNRIKKNRLIQKYEKRHISLYKTQSEFDNDFKKYFSNISSVRKSRNTSENHGKMHS